MSWISNIIRRIINRSNSDYHPMETADTIEKNLRADIEALRQQYPATQDLYREVCTVMFFRYGMTPTTNKLYQFVRKGSMSAPAEALNRFWENLREKSRVTIDHPNLPDALKEAAGGLVATLWRAAQEAANEHLAQLQSDAATEVGEARDVASKSLADLGMSRAELTSSQEELRDALGRIDVLRHEITSFKSHNCALESQLQSARADLDASQLRLDACRADFAAELEKLRLTEKQNQERLREAESRALLEIDRERTAAAQARKSLDGMRAEKITAEERWREEITPLQQRFAGQRHQNGLQEGGLRAMVSHHEKANLELDHLRQQLAAVGAENSELRIKIVAVEKMNERLSEENAVDITKSLPQTRKRTKRSA